MDPASTSKNSRTKRDSRAKLVNDFFVQTLSGGSMTQTASSRKSNSVSRKHKSGLQNLQESIHAMKKAANCDVLSNQRSLDYSLDDSMTERSTEHVKIEVESSENNHNQAATTLGIFERMRMTLFGGSIVETSAAAQGDPAAVTVKEVVFKEESCDMSNDSSMLRSIKNKSSAGYSASRENTGTPSSVTKEEGGAASSTMSSAITVEKNISYFTPTAAQTSQASTKFVGGFGQLVDNVNITTAKSGQKTHKASTQHKQKKLLQHQSSVLDDLETYWQQQDACINTAIGANLGIMVRDAAV